MERYEGVKASRKQILINNFLGGLSWALGATIGLAITVFVLGILSKNINLVPVVGNFVSDVIREVLQKNPQLIKYPHGTTKP